MGLTKEQKIEIFSEHGGSGTNTGSVEAQIAMFTRRINDISEHLNENKKDHSSRLTLIKMVGRRRKFLKYLADKDINKYRALIEKLGLRK